LGKEPLVITDSRVDGLQSSFGHCGEEIIFLPPLRVERRLLGPASLRLAFSLTAENFRKEAMNIAFRIPLMYPESRR
jgi:hypothetical protein